MVRTLVECGYTEEAEEVAQRICSILQDAVPHSISALQINSYFDAVITLYIDREDFLSLEPLVIPVFTGITPRQQCRLLIELHEKRNCRLENTPSGHNLYKKMCRLLLHDRLCTVSNRETIRQVITCYVELGDVKVLELFIGHVLSSTGIENLWIEVFLTTTDPATFTLLLSCLNKKMEAVKTLAIDPDKEDENVHRAELAGFFCTFLHLQTFPQLPDSARLSAFNSVYPNMPEDRLSNLMVDLLQNGAAKKFPSSYEALNNMALSLLKRPTLSGIQTICLLLQQFSSLLDDKSSTYLLRLVRAICFNCKWSQPTINRLMEKIFSSSEMWKDDDTSRLCLSHLMTSWIAALERVMASDSVQSDGRKRRSFRADFATCFFSYVKETKKGRDLGTDLFSPLLEKMDMQELSHLVWDIYQLDIKNTTSLKDVPKTLNMYRDLCLRLLDSGEKSRVWILGWAEPKTDSMIVKTSVCVLWLGDEYSNSLFSNLILTSSNPGAIISTIIKSKTVLDLARCLPHVKELLIAILEKRRICQIAKMSQLTKNLKKVETEKVELDQAIASIESQFEPTADGKEPGISDTPAKKQRVQ